MVTLQAAVMAAALSGFGQTVLLDFYADWCGPCRAMNPTVDALIAAGYPVQRVNKDQQPALAAKYRVTSIPCFVMVVDGQEVDRVVGGTSYSRLERMCKMSATARGPAGGSPLLAMNGPTARQAPPTQLPVPNAPPASTTPWNNAPASFNPPVAAPAAASGATLPAAFAANPSQGSSPVPDTALLSASVRLRIEDPDGRSCGSGTIIDSRDGEALILTCGHIFRDSKGRGKIHVDLFGSSGPQSVEGQLISFDLTRDVGLVAIHTTTPVAVARLAPADYRITRGLSVATVGCNNGDNPTVRHSYLTALDKYVGPPTVTVAGQPVEGRSGGGLFTNEGYVIGVCNAADPHDKEGLFAALGSIYAELDKARLDFVYKRPSGQLNPSIGVTEPAALASATLPAMPSQSPLNAGIVPTSASLAADATPTVLPAHEQAALQEIQRRIEEGAEVVCIVRPRGNPDAKSEVIMLDHASPGFLKQLASQGRRQHELRELSYVPVARNVASSSRSEDGQPPKSRKILEWKAPESR